PRGISQLAPFPKAYTQFPPLRADAFSDSPGWPKRTVTWLPRNTCVPASGNCSTATPVPISDGASPSFEHNSVTPRTVCPVRLGTDTLSSPNAIVGAEPDDPLLAFAIASANRWWPSVALASRGFWRDPTLQS